MLYIRSIKGYDTKKRPFTAYVLLTEEQRDFLEPNKKCNLNQYEVFYTKLGHDISNELHQEIMQTFAAIPGGNILNLCIHLNSVVPESRET
jgi:hypothetical protein